MSLEVPRPVLKGAKALVDHKSPHWNTKFGGEWLSAH